VRFAMLSGNLNLIHINAEYAKDKLVCTRIAHGLLVLSNASAQLCGYV